MKKNVSKITAAILSLVLMFSGVFSLIVSADEPEVRPPCLQDHFGRLNKPSQSVSPNMEGTCVFVAMSMMLGYYDSYWRDDFIRSMDDGQHEMDWDRGEYNSISDRLIKTFHAGTEAAAWGNRSSGTNEEFSENHEYEYLQSYLMQISQEEYNILQVALVEVQVKHILEVYLYERCGFTEEQITVNIQHQLTHGDNTLYTTMKQQISQGNPVMYLGLSLDVLPENLDGDFAAIGGHAMVAFDVVTKEYGEDIKLHTGWNDNDTNDDSDDTDAQNDGENYDYVNTTNFSHHNSIIWLDINEELLPHVCTDAYEDTATNQNVCACYVYSNTHPAHCSHNYHCTPKNDSYHHDICGCGVAINQTRHTFTYSTYSTAFHSKYCASCGYSFYEPHNLIFEQYSTEYHKKRCTVCGEEQMASHSASRYVDYDSSYHRIYCDCGEYMGFASHIAASTGKFQSYCVYCNRSMPNPGSGGLIPGIMGKPDESGEYTE